jgi:hypothetical protein
MRKVRFWPLNSYIWFKLPPKLFFDSNSPQTLSSHFSFFPTFSFMSLWVIHFFLFVGSFACPKNLFNRMIKWVVPSLSVRPSLSSSYRSNIDCSFQFKIIKYVTFSLAWCWFITIICGSFCILVWINQKYERFLFKFLQVESWNCKW